MNLIVRKFKKIKVKRANMIFKKASQKEEESN